MNKIFRISALILAAMFSLASCVKTPELVLTDKGPEMTISVPESAFMGADIKFSVTLNDSDFALSTLKVKLLFDETEVSSVAIRTKQNGSYEGSVHVPLLGKEIPDGTASLVFAAQNVGMGVTTETKLVAVKRPNPAKVSLLTEEGNEIEMAKTADYKYEVTKEFPNEVYSHIIVREGEETIKLGWDGKQLAVNGNAIPFSSTLPGVYTISVDLKELTATPFDYVLSMDVDLSKEDNGKFYKLRQNIGLDFTKISDIIDWDLDPDFFTVEGKHVLFDAVDGYYMFTADFDNTYIKVEPVNENGERLNIGENCDGAVWMIGAQFGKPSIGPGWNTTDGAYSFAQISSKVFRLTLNVGSQIAPGFDLKIFHQKGWGGEFLKANYAEFDGADIFDMTDSGNIKIKNITPDSTAVLADGKAYCFTLDLNGGKEAAKLSVKEVEVVGGAPLNIKVNGAKASKVSKTVYKVKSMKLKKGDVITVAGVEDFDGWYLDPDHFSFEAGTCPECGQNIAAGAKFNAVEGFYSFEMDLENKFVTIRRVKENGNPATYKDERAITIMGWGVAHPVMAQQLAWETGILITLAEVEPGVYQFTGKAVEETDATTLGGRWRYDYVSFKFFGQAGWGAEWKNVNLTDEAKKFLKSPGNVELADDVKLEKGATYRMTVTNCTDLVDNKFDCTIDFKKL